MSSESSVSSNSSRIRQFGLYRTIDARTEEFLRLSRKRQIRQGCACAIVSTAITVTVVVVILIAYEISGTPNMNLETTFKYNWLTLMNDTNTNGFGSNTNLDRATLQMLPLILQALKKNIILGSVIEEPSSSNPIGEENYPIGPNVVAKSYVKVPTSKLYAIEYKTFPVVYYRNPTKDLETFTKTRKIRDYNRIANYMDKMINGKLNVIPAKTLPKKHVMYPRFIGNSEAQRNKKQEKKVEDPIPKLKENVKIKSFLNHKMFPVDYKPKSTDDNKNCSCRKRLSNILSKMIFDVKSLFIKSTQQLKSQLKCDQQGHDSNSSGTSYDSFFEPEKPETSTKQTQHVWEQMTLEVEQENHSNQNLKYNLVNEENNDVIINSPNKKLPLGTKVTITETANNLAKNFINNIKGDIVKFFKKNLMLPSYHIKKKYEAPPEKVATKPAFRETEKMRLNKIINILKIIKTKNYTCTNCKKTTHDGRIMIQKPKPPEKTYNFLYNKNSQPITSQVDAIDTDQIPEFQSMLPHSRPMYLEIHRDWKKDDNNLISKHIH